MSPSSSIEEFLEKFITPQELALRLRRFKLEALKLVLRTPDDEYHKQWIADGFYWLTELCEQLDPQLEEPDEK